MAKTKEELERMKKHLEELKKLQKDVEEIENNLKERILSCKFFSEWLKNQEEIRNDKSMFG